MLLAEVDYASGFIHASRDVPDVEVLRRIHNEEFAKAVHEGRGACALVVVRVVVVYRAPLDLHHGQLTSIAPNGDGRGVGVMIDAGVNR